MSTTDTSLSPKCPIRTTLSLVGGKWKLLVIYQLAEGPLRLSQLKQNIPDISEKMLVETLKTLVQDHLVHRENFGEVPPRVEYSLTAQGRLALPLMASMIQFSQQYTAISAP
jgi:DNA-binding HxlR family transcriptional regulator